MFQSKSRVHRHFLWGSPSCPWCHSSWWLLDTADLSNPQASASFKVPRAVAWNICKTRERAERARTARWTLACLGLKRRMDEDGKGHLWAFAVPDVPGLLGLWVKDTLGWWKQDEASKTWWHIGPLCHQEGCHCGMDFPDFGLPVDFRSRKLARPDSRTCFLTKEMGDPVFQNLMSLQALEFVHDTCFHCKLLAVVLQILFCWSSDPISVLS